MATDTMIDLVNLTDGLVRCCPTFILFTAYSSPFCYKCRMVQPSTSDSFLYVFWI